MSKQFGPFVTKVVATVVEVLADSGVVLLIDPTGARWFAAWFVVDVPIGEVLRGQTFTLTIEQRAGFSVVGLCESG